MKTFIYKKKPNVSELWDDCIYSLVYNTKKYVQDIEALFKKLNISKNSKILDSSAGSGFPAFELTQKGYNLSCMDFSKEAIGVFNKKAKQKKVNLKCKKLAWLDIPKVWPKNYFDFIFCRGNSFIYASGGWGSKGNLKPNIALNNYKKTLKVFYDAMKPGAWIYIDKFKDNEKTSKEQVGKVKVGKQEFDWYFYRNPMPKIHLREAKMILESEDEAWPIVNFKTYLLTFKEMKQIMKKIGFKKIKKIKIKSEIDFDILIAQK
jgi:ubiquinone/menaquinone biosynthesis C-methylase UbiE